MTDYEARKTYIARRDQSMRLVDEVFDSPFKVADLKVPDEIPTDAKPLFMSLVSDDDRKILQIPPMELLDKLKSGTLKAVPVAGVFCRAAVVAQKLVNCCTEFLPDLALMYAKKADEYMELHNKPMGPFHGFPLSIKELYALEGRAAHWENPDLINNMQTENAVLVDGLLELGCVPFCRTTAPQFLMSIESFSPMHGLTTNPHNTKLSSGGSSAGEGAMIAIGASHLGLGSDIGGSIRVPSACCGIYGYRPTNGRVPITGADSLTPGYNAIAGVVGPMASSADLITLFMESIESLELWKRDTFAERSAWKPVNPKEVTVGYLLDDGCVKPHPPVERAIKEFIAKMEKAKLPFTVKFKPFTPMQHEEAWKIITGLYFPDGGQFLKDALANSGEKATDQTKMIALENPNCVEHSVKTLYAAQDTRNKYKTAYQKHWKEQGIDVLIMPTVPSAAIVPNTTKYWGYTCVWNLLDYPATIMPIGKVQESDKKEESYKPRNDLDKAHQELYSPETYENAPVGLQIVAPRWNDELTLKMMEVFAHAM
ncbi:putative amidase [Yarrowia sp. B02]|nr:putative amidase [Yarrowia sp. B02]